jgi:hypothetical protein
MMRAVRAHEHLRLATKRKKAWTTRGIYKGRKEGEHGQDIIARAASPAAKQECLAIASRNVGVHFVVEGPSFRED